MGYQALLFCADEATAGLVTQVLTELEFSVEPANEPFAAVKRLTTQHFDAVVVDCDNEQNASLLFKSARNSGPNKTSLAVAVVEGQPGIAKAFRIGANLVLTKPINIEQSKGTLRVARGLLKKSDATKPAAIPQAPAMSAPTNPAFSRPLTPVAPGLKPVVPPKSITSRPAPPAVRPEAPSMLELEAEPIPQTESADAALLASMPDPIAAAPAPKAITPKAAWPPATSTKPFLGGVSSSGEATGVAPAREIAPRHSETLEPKPTFAPAFSEPARPVAHHVETRPAAPALSTPAPAGAGGAQKWILVAAAIVLAAACGYFASTKIHSGSSASVSNAPTAPAQSAPAQEITLGTSPSPTSAQPASTSQVTASTPKPQAAANQNIAQEETSDDTNESEVKKSGSSQKSTSSNAEKPAREPLQVRNSAPRAAIQSQAEIAPQAIPVIGIASNSGDKALSGIMQAEPTARTPILKTMKVSQGVSQGLVLKKVSPDYPAQARQLRIEGTVQLEATIAKDGKVSNIKAVSGHPILARAAIDAVKQWKYRPYLLNGQPVEIETQIAVNFKLP